MGIADLLKSMANAGAQTGRQTSTQAGSGPSRSSNGWGQIGQTGPQLAPSTDPYEMWQATNPQWAWQDPQEAYQTYYDNVMGSPDFTLRNEDEAKRGGNRAAANRAARNLVSQNMQAGDTDYANYIQSAYAGNQLSPSDQYWDRYNTDLNNIYNQYDIEDKDRYVGLNNVRQTRSQDIENKQTLSPQKTGDLRLYANQEDEFRRALKETEEGQRIAREYGIDPDAEDAYINLLASNNYDLLKDVFTYVPGWMGGASSRYKYDPEDFDTFYNEAWLPNKISYGDYVNRTDIPVELLVDMLYWGAENQIMPTGGKSAEDFQLDSLLELLADKSNEFNLTDADYAAANEIFERRNFAPRLGKVVEGGSYVPYADLVGSNTNLSNNNRYKQLEQIANTYNERNKDKGSTLGFRQG